MNFTKLGWAIVRQRPPFCHWFPSGPGPSAEYTLPSNSDWLKGAEPGTAFSGTVQFAFLTSPRVIEGP